MLAVSTIGSIRLSSSSNVSLASTATVFTSSPTQLLMAEGVMVRVGVQPGPSFSSDTGGYISPARSW